MALGAFLAGMVVGPIRVQRARRRRRAADARRLRRAVLRLGRDAVRSRHAARRSADAGGDAGHRPDRQAAGRAGHRRCCSATRCRWRCRSRWRWRRSASSRSSSPSVATDYGVLTADATNVLVAAAIVVDHAQPAALPQHRLDGAVAAPRRPARGAAAPGGRARRAAGVPRHRRRLRPGRAHGDAPPPRERHRADHRRDERGHRPRGPRDGPARDLRRRHPPGRPRRGGHRRGARLHHRGVAARGRRGRLPARARAGTPASASWPAPPTCARRATCVRPAPTSCSPARAKSRSPSPTEILADLGATPDQIDRERSRVRGELG